MQSMGLWSLDHDLTASFGLSHAPNFPKIHPHLHRCNSVRVHLYAHPQHIKVLKHFTFIWYGCGMQSTGLWSLNHDLTASLGLSHAPNFPKIHPNLHMRNSVRVHPYAHPQHIKVLKHFVYTWYGCGMQSMGLWSLNHDLTTSLGLSHTPNFPKIHPHLSLSMYTISTVAGCIIFDIFVEQLCYPRYISPTHSKFCELLLRDIANKTGKRSVGSRWWSVCPHGHYHHGSVHRMHDGSMVDSWGRPGLVGK